MKIAKLNIDENPQTPPKYGIRGIPTLILFKNGTVEAQKVGALSKSQLAAFLDSNLDEAATGKMRGYLGNQGRNRPRRVRATAAAVVTRNRRRQPRRTAVPMT